MKYLKTYENRKESLLNRKENRQAKVESKKDALLKKKEFHQRIGEEALELGFKYSEGNNTYHLKIDENYSLALSRIDIYLIRNNQTPTYLTFLKDEDSKDTIERIVNYIKTIASHDKIYDEIDSNPDLKDILTNYLDKGYEIVSKDSIYYNIEEDDIIGFNTMLSCGNVYNFEISFPYEWKYLIELQFQENQDDKTIDKDFNIFNSYLKIINLKAEINKSNYGYRESSNSFLILIDKIN